MGAKAKEGLDDFWRKVDVQRALARELHKATEAERLAGFYLRELEKSSSLGLAASDGNLRIVQARSEYARAHEKWLTALGRWKAFVIKGTIPADLEV